MSSEDRQIQAMIEFIERDAQEKAREYDDEAQSLYDSEKANLVEAAKKKVAASSAEQKKQLDVDRRVARAQVSKQQRMRVMEERISVLENVKEQTKAGILKLVKDQGKYKTLMADLLRQSAVAVDADADVFVRKADEGLAKGLLKQTEQAVQAATGKAVKLTIAKDNLDDDEAWGGCVLKSAGGHNIVCDNSLSYRTRNCFNEQLPTVRHFLFHDKAQF